MTLKREGTTLCERALFTQEVCMRKESMSVVSAAFLREQVLRNELSVLFQFCCLFLNTEKPHKLGKVFL
jgi:hypothetical protein